MNAKEIIEILKFHSEGGTDKNGDYSGVIPELFYEDIAQEIEAKSKEEAGKRYEMACEHRKKKWPNWVWVTSEEGAEIADKTIKLAAFGKEGER